MKAKLGLSPTSEVMPVLDAVLALLRDTRADYNSFFRLLCYFYVNLPEHKQGSLKITTDNHIEQFFVDALNEAKGANASFAAESTVTEDELRKRARSWMRSYRAALAVDPATADDGARLTRLRRVNPLRVPKGWILEEISETLHKSPWTTIRWETAVAREDEEAKENQSILLDMPRDGVIDEAGYVAAHGSAGPPTAPPERDVDFGVVQRALRVLGEDMFGEVTEDGFGGEKWSEEDHKAAARWSGKAPE
ncbi:hypothetical protein HDU93_004964, partial [Gonapodya sp. JEL0774]